MAAVTNNLKDWKDLYDGFNYQTVGIGLTDPNIYHSKAYALKKQQVLVLGGLTEFIYAGFDHDQAPQVLTIKYEPQYNTVLGFNLHYIPQTYRQAILKMVISMNKPRMEQNLPLYIDYDAIKSKIPLVENIVRRYKVTGIRVIGNVPLTDWAKAVLGPNRWQTIYKGLPNMKTV